MSVAPDQTQPWTMPHNIEAEASILGGIILRNDAIASVNAVETDDFYDHKHKVVFEAMRNLEALAEPIDVVTLENQIRNGGKLEAIGGIAFLGELTLRVPTPDNVVAYAEIVRKHARDRRAIEKISEALQSAKHWPHEADEMVGELVGRLQRLDHASTAARKRIGRTWDECVDEIYARKDEAWTEIRIGDVVIATCRAGSFVPLVAPSGSGKSSLALQIIVEHALYRGPAIYVTPELDGDEAVGRAIGQMLSYSWVSVLRGEVPRSRVSSVPRLRVLEIEDATVDKLLVVAAELAELYPGEPILGVWDYIQASPAPPGKERGFVANQSSELRRAAKSAPMVLMGISQSSTENSAKLRDGKLLGIDGAATGAETSQIERDGYVILTLGDRRPVDRDTVSWQLSTAKYRLGVPDIVHEVHYQGRIGRWEVVGDPKSASEVRANRDAEHKQKKIAELRRAILALLQGSKKPMTRTAIVEASTGNDKMIYAVIKELIGAGELVVMTGGGRGGSTPIWTPEKACEENS